MWDISPQVLGQECPEDPPTPRTILAVTSALGCRPEFDGEALWLDILNFGSQGIEKSG